MTDYIVCDCMLGKLARMLRILGYVVYYDSTADDTKLLQISKKYNAILLTRDLELSKLYSKAVYVSSHDIREQLKYALKVLDSLNLRPAMKPMETCPECGTPIIPCDREYIKGNYYESTYCTYNTFYFCPNCKKVYWEGYQYRNLIRTLKDLEDKAIT